jgi:hypothetical protein
LATKTFDDHEIEQLITMRRGSSYRHEYRGSERLSFIILHRCCYINRVETIQSDRPVQTTRSRSYLRSFNSMVLETKIDLRATQSQHNTSQRLLQSRPTTELRPRGGIQTPSRNPSHSETSYQMNTVNKLQDQRRGENGDIRTTHTTHIHPHGDESSQNPETEKSKTEQ